MRYSINYCPVLKSVAEKRSILGHSTRGLWAFKIAEQYGVDLILSDPNLAASKSDFRIRHLLLTSIRRQFIQLFRLYFAKPIHAGRSVALI